MKKTIHHRLMISIFILLLLSSCSFTGYLKNKSKVSFQAGINQGGIVDNTDMSVVPGVEPTPESTIDAYSGATRMGGSAGVRFNIPLLRNEVETGLDFMYNSQEFSYADQGNHYIGARDLQLSQFMLPVTYNFILFRKLLPGAELQIRLGYLAQFNLLQAEGTGLLPDYSFNRFSNGATLGLSAYLVKFRNGDKLGLFIDGYRGTQIYKDHYNQESFEIPGSSFARFGLRYRVR